MVAYKLITNELPYTPVYEPVTDKNKQPEIVNFKTYDNIMMVS